TADNEPGNVSGRFHRNMTADHYLVMSRGAIIRQGKGEDMETDGGRGLVSI
ncbi:TPA: hypothetical protein ACWS8Y_004591, partial [Escherichia coli]